MQKGFIYLVDGPKKFYKEFLYSVKSLKKHHPLIPVTLFTTDTSIKKESNFDVVYLKGKKVHINLKWNQF